MKKLRIGFLSTAGIGRKNWKAIFNSGNCVVAAVASRDVQKSLKFIDECQREFPFTETPRAFGSYEELIASPDVDAVYIPLPTGLRKEFVLRAAAAGKHILCGQPKRWPHPPDFFGVQFLSRRRFFPQQHPRRRRA